MYGCLRSAMEREIDAASRRYLVKITLDFVALLDTLVPGSTQQHRQYTDATSLTDVNETWPSRLWTNQNCHRSFLQGSTFPPRMLLIADRGLIP